MPIGPITVADARTTLENASRTDEISAHTFHGARFLGNTEGLKIAEDHAVQTTMQDRLTAVEMSVEELIKLKEKVGDLEG